MLEENGLKISMEKTKYPRPRHFHVDTYLFKKTITNCRTIQQFGLNYTSRRRMRDKYVTNRNRWREISGVIWDKKVPELCKSKMFKTAIRPAMTYGGECCAIRKCEENQANTT